MEIEKTVSVEVTDDDGTVYDLTEADLRAAIQHHISAGNGRKTRPVVRHLQRHAGHYLAGTWFGGEGIVSAMSHNDLWLRSSSISLICVGLVFLVIEARTR